MKEELLDLLDYLPQTIESGKQYSLRVNFDEEHIDVSYSIDVVAPSGSGTREYSCVLPRFIPKNEETFEVLGLLQAEMGKTDNGSLSFPNHEYKIINRVLRWFEETGFLSHGAWRWSIKLNINEPPDTEYKREVEKRVIDHWTTKTKINLDKKYQKTVTYVNENYTNNKLLKHADYGTLVLEYKNKLFSDIIKHLVKKITYEKILTFDKDLIRGFMRGIIAGEGCVEDSILGGHYRVHITAVNPNEREIYWHCLLQLGIKSAKYESNKDIIISRKENHILLLKKQLMTLSPAKYNKFRYMLQRFPDIVKDFGYFKEKGTFVPHRIPREKTAKIIELYNSGMKKTKEIAKILDISTIKVNRVLFANNLGKRLVKTPEPLRKEIAHFVINNFQMSNEEIAKKFAVHKSVVRRICKAYGITKGNKSKCKIPEEKLQRIIQMYKENPTLKVSQICKEIGVSSTVVRRVKRENNLQNLGFRHIIGNNNKKYKDALNNKKNK